MIQIVEASQMDVPAFLASREAETGEQYGKDVDEILKNVRENGDKAVLSYTKKFDKAELSSLLLTKEEWEAGAAAVPASLYETLEKAAANIADYHKRQKKEGFTIAEKEGIILGQCVMPLDTVGIYVPGGTASYPSTVLMNAIPAALAGCRRIIMATPPDANGNIAPSLLAAAKIAGVTEIYKMGGAQAVAALAYGTETVPRADKIVGPGNIYVALAKRRVFGIVDIDMIAGPSEILVVADDKNDPAVIAADLLSQAEHDRMAASLLITDSRAFAEAVVQEIEAQLALLPREEIARESIETNGRILLVRDLKTEGLSLANQIAPEHLELCVDDPFSLLPLVKNAGSVFLGRYTPEALGDYFAGTNHTLPTNGTARFSSPLSLDDFTKKSSFLYYTKEALHDALPHIEAMAETEGLYAHGKSAAIRFQKGREV